MTKKIAQLPPIEHQGVRVVTLSLMDEIHERPSGTAGRNFRQHRERLIEGEDYWEIPTDEFRRLGLSEQSGGKDGIVLSESGYLMLVKSFRDDFAWEVQRAMVNHYFKPAATKDVLVQILNRLENRTAENQTDVALLNAKVDSGFEEINGRFDGVEQELHRIQNRRSPKKATLREFAETVIQCYRRNCPCCEEVEIYSDMGERLVQHNVDHWFSPSKNKSTETWPVCRECNLRLRDDSQFKLNRQKSFDLFQERRERITQPLL